MRHITYACVDVNAATGDDDADDDGDYQNLRELSRISSNSQHHVHHYHHHHHHHYHPSVNQPAAGDDDVLSQQTADQSTPSSQGSPDTVSSLHSSCIYFLSIVNHFNNLYFTTSRTAIIQQNILYASTVINKYVEEQTEKLQACARR